jgi:single-strand DNA-binding protein
MLRVTLIGHLGSDAELRTTQKGSPLVEFRVAVNLVRPGPDGDREERTEWFRVRAMGRQTDFLQRLTKGARVFVTGRLGISHYQSREGEPRTAFDIWADDVQDLTPRSNTEPGNRADRGTQTRTDQRSAAGRRPAEHTRPPVQDDDDLPDLPF